MHSYLRNGRINCGTTGVVKDGAARSGIEKLAPHDLRRTCAHLCHLAGAEFDQIQFLLGLVSIAAPGCKQTLRIALNDNLGIESGQPSRAVERGEIDRPLPTVFQTTTTAGR